MSSSSTGLDPLHLLHTLQELWTKKEIHELREEAGRGFASLTDPHEGVLVLLESCHNWRKGKAQSLGYYIISEFDRWIKEHPPVQQPAARQKMLHPRVFSLLLEAPSNSLGLLISLYDLESADQSYLFDLVTYMRQKGKYKEAVSLSIKMRLQPALDVEEMCIPLLLQDKTNLVEAYVADYPDLQRQLVQTLDSWCDSTVNIRDIRRRYERVVHIRWEKLNRKVLSKLVFRLLELYGIDPAICPNVVNQRYLASVKYLLHKRFVEKSMSEENWSEHIQATIGQNRWLQEQLVSLLMRYTDLDTVARWALWFNVPRENLSYSVGKRLKELEKNNVTGPESGEAVESWQLIESRRRWFYQLPISTANIHFLHSLDQLRSCAPSLLKAGAVLGIDMEWRPTFGVLMKSRVSIMQVALKDRVYLMDMPQLVNQAETEGREAELIHFIHTLFTDQTITKLGYGTAGDLRSLSSAYPLFKDIMHQTAGMIDLLIIHKKLQKVPDRRAGGSREVDVVASGQEDVDLVTRQSEKGLSLLVRHVLGKPLDKTEQLSNWEKRPLRQNQIIYAAIDAYCLLEVYEPLLREPQQFGLSYSLNDSLVGKSEKRSKEQKRKKNKNKAGISEQRHERTSLPLPDDTAPLLDQVLPVPEEADAPAFLPVPPSEFSVICDSMLQGLGRYLRCLGVDVKMLENEDDHRKAAEIACEEGRVILTCGLPYQVLRSQVGEGRCFSVNCSDKAKDQAIKVLKHFNVQVTPADIFSRCQVCNGNRYLKLPVDEMAKMMKLKPDRTRARSADAKGARPGMSCEEAGSRDISARALEDSGRGQPGHSAYRPNCHWVERSWLDPETLRFTSGASLQVGAVPPGILDKVDVFYCCTGCGKVFWEGSHFGRVVSQFKEVLHIPDGATFYNL
uniref:Putative exonuclease mut-7-like protein n=1 Tax=Callorhinchus milii TaxID=7868 RepID=V9KEI2_CALMI